MPGANERCEIHEMLTCAICLGHDKPERYTTADLDYGHKFPARYASVCAIDPSHPIVPGEIIVALRDGTGYACEHCLEVLPSG